MGVLQAVAVGVLQAVMSCERTSRAAATAPMSSDRMQLGCAGGLGIVPSRPEPRVGVMQPGRADAGISCASSAATSAAAASSSSKACWSCRCCCCARPICICSMCSSCCCSRASYASSCCFSRASRAEDARSSARSVAFSAAAPAPGFCWGWWRWWGRRGGACAQAGGGGGRSAVAERKETGRVQRRVHGGGCRPAAEQPRTQP